ncbi:MAG: MNIO family bufferin maturase [Thermoanaerobaculia bacterium]
MRGAEGEERRPGEEVLTPAPFLGHGIGLRREHYAEILAGEVACDWFEAISENYMAVGGRARKVLLAVRERYPVTLHGVSLGIGSTDPIDEGYLDALDRLAADVEPAWISDHLCWTGVEGRTSHDLLPLPYTEEALSNVIERVRRVQDRLGRPLVLENVSSYVTWRTSTIPEEEFLAELARRSGCGLLLDVNNVFVSATNHGGDPRRWLEAIPKGSVWQIHLAGPSEAGPLLVDTHDHPVRPEVWELYREAVRRFGEVSSLVEWDDRIPEIGVVLAERDKAAAIAAEARAGQLGEAGRDGAPAVGVFRATCERVTGQEPPGKQTSARATESGPDPITRLRGAQSVMMGLVRAPEGVAKALEERDRAREEVAALFAGDARMSAVSRLELYARMYFFRLRDSLAEDFARTAAALGEARWHNLVTDYLLAHPPTSWSLRWAGEALPEFLRAHAYGAERPWLADVAALEQARNEAFQALDATPLRPEELAVVLPEAWPHLRFVPAPGTALVSSRWDLAGWWDDGASSDAPDAFADETTLLVFRDAEDDVRHEAIAPEEAEAARLLLAGAPFAEVCGAFADAAADETDAARRALALVRRMGSGLHSTLCGDAECRV